MRRSGVRSPRPSHLLPELHPCASAAAAVAEHGAVPELATILSSLSSTLASLLPNVAKRKLSATTSTTSSKEELFGMLRVAPRLASCAPPPLFFFFLFPRPNPFFFLLIALSLSVSMSLCVLFYTACFRCCIAHLSWVGQEHNIVKHTDTHTFSSLTRWMILETLPN